MDRDVAVIIPTLRRPDSLTRAVRSVLAQREALDRVQQIVIVDNDPTGSARSTVSELAQGGAVPVDYVHAPRPGIATARNAGLAATDAALIAWIDDDEAAHEGWLRALIDAQARLGADVVFGPIRGRTPEGTGWTRAYLDRFFGREGPETTRRIDHAYGCGNSLMLRATALAGPAPFDLAADHSGGEDDALFSRLEGQGAVFGWAAEAWVDEFAPPHRATLAYALTRAFAYGQGPSQTAARHRDWAGLARWMLIGAAQASVWLSLAGMYAALRHPKRADAYDKAARGLGKVLWFKGFEPHFYGARELARLDAQAA